MIAFATVHVCLRAGSSTVWTRLLRCGCCLLIPKLLQLLETPTTTCIVYCWSVWYTNAVLEIYSEPGARNASKTLVDYLCIISDPHPSRFLLPVQGYAARNVSLAGVSSLTGLDRLEVGRLSLSGPSASSASNGGIVAGQMAILTTEGELLSAGQAFSVEPETGTFLAPRIGAHDVTGNVDFLGNALLNTVLESPAIRYVSISPTVYYFGAVACFCGEAVVPRVYDLFLSTTHRFVLLKL